MSPSMRITLEWLEISRISENTSYANRNRSNLRLGMVNDWNFCFHPGFLYCRKGFLYCLFGNEFSFKVVSIGADQVCNVVEFMDKHITGG